MAVRAVLGGVLGAALLLAGPAVHAATRDKMEIKNADDIKVSIWATIEPRYFKAGFNVQRGIPEPEFNRAVADVTELMGRMADKHGAPRFVVTGMFCAIFATQSRITRQTCAIEGTWLMDGERLVPNPSAARPVYLSTKAALERSIDSSWADRFDLRAGLKGKFSIVKDQDDDLTVTEAGD